MGYNFVLQAIFALPFGNSFCILMPFEFQTKIRYSVRRAYLKSRLKTYGIQMFTLLKCHILSLLLVKLLAYFNK